MSRRFGLVLGAGGGTGRAFHAGVLAALHQVAGVDARRADVIVATSAGSIDGSFLRAGVGGPDLLARISRQRVSPQAEAMFDRVPQWIDPDEEGPATGWRPASGTRLRSLALRPWEMRPGSVGTLFAAMMPEGRRPTRLIDETVAALHPSGWPRSPLWICTVRLDDGQRVVFGRDPGACARPGEAAAASCAIPGYFAPVVIGGARYVDGGAHSPSNADLLVGCNLDVVIVSSPMTAAPRALRLSPDGAFRAACGVLLRREIARLRRRGATVILFEPESRDIEVMGSVSDSMAAARRERVATRVFETVSRRLHAGRTASALQSILA